MDITTLPLNQLRPHEKGSPLYHEMLRQEIVRDGILKHPIIADRSTFVILDGMHRWLALKSLGYALIPTILVDVFHDRGIQVSRREINCSRSELAGDISIKDVISAGIEKHLMEPKSTKHIFPFSKRQQINCQLEMLRKRSPTDVSQFIANMTETECKVALHKWVYELREELAVPTAREKETESELQELQLRIIRFDHNQSKTTALAKSWTTI